MAAWCRVDRRLGGDFVTFRIDGEGDDYVVALFDRHTRANAAVGVCHGNAVERERGIAVVDCVGDVEERG